jgi:hypothetical protein
VLLLLLRNVERYYALKQAMQVMLKSLRHKQQ